MDTKGFLGSLFDFSFRSLVTPQIVQLLYVLALIAVAIYTLVIIGAAFAAGSVVGIVALILSPVIFIILATFARVYLEVAIVFFRIAESTETTAQNTARQPQQSP